MYKKLSNPADITPHCTITDCLIICYCAMWCNICREYHSKFINLAKNIIQYSFYWIDIEQQPELLGEEDIDNFPTILIQIKEKTVFFGPITPKIFYLKRLLESFNQNSPMISTGLPDIGYLLNNLI